MSPRTDIDGTLIVPRDGRKFPRNETDWTWLNPQVVPKLRQLHQDGYVRRGPGGFVGEREGD